MTESNFQSFKKLIEVADGEGEPRATVRISDEIKNAFLSGFKRVEFPKGTILNIPGKVVEDLYFIESGLIITSFSTDGREICTGFFAEDDIGGDLVSFLTNKLGKQTVRTIEPTVVYTLNRRDLYNFHQKYPAIEDILMQLNHYLLTKQQIRIEDLLHGSAFDRYNKFLERYPEVVHRLPLGFIASYLGMSQETLSRIRSQKGGFDKNQTSI